MKDGIPGFFSIAALGGLILFGAYHSDKWVRSWLYTDARPPDWLRWLIGIGLVVFLVGWVGMWFRKEWAFWCWIAGGFVFVPTLLMSYRLLQMGPYILYLWLIGQWPP